MVSRFSSVVCQPGVEPMLNGFSALVRPFATRKSASGLPMSRNSERSLSTSGRSMSASPEVCNAPSDAAIWATALSTSRGDMFWKSENVERLKVGVSMPFARFVSARVIVPVAPARPFSELEISSVRFAEEDAKLASNRSSAVDDERSWTVSLSSSSGSVIVRFASADALAVPLSSASRMPTMMGLADAARLAARVEPRRAVHALDPEARGGRRDVRIEADREVDFRVQRDGVLAAGREPGRTRDRERLGERGPIERDAEHDRVRGGGGADVGGDVEGRARERAVVVSTVRAVGVVQEVLEIVDTRGRGRRDLRGEVVERALEPEARRWATATRRGSAPRGRRDRRSR